MDRAGEGLRCNRGLHDAAGSSEAGVALQTCPNSDKKPDFCTPTLGVRAGEGVTEGKAVP